MFDVYKKQKPEKEKVLTYEEMMDELGLRIESDYFPEYIPSE